MHIEVKQADLLEVEGDGLVVPTVSDGTMVEEIPAQVKEAAGQEVENEVVKSAPIAVGAAVVTKPGELSLVQHVIHVPVVEQPGLKIGVENVRRATRASLLAATHFQMERVVIPGFGFGEVGVPYDEAARAIIDELRAYKGSHPTVAVLVSTDEEMYEAFRQELHER